MGQGNSRPFKTGCFPQILLGPFLNNLTQIYLRKTRLSIKFGKNQTRLNIAKDPLAAYLKVTISKKSIIVKVHVISFQK